MPEGMPRKREEIDEKDRWAVEDLYADDKLWQQDYDRLSLAMEALLECRGRLAESADVLYRALSLQDEISMSLERIYVYANERWHENTADGVYQDLSSRAEQLMTKWSGICAFLEPELLTLQEERLRSFLEEDDRLLRYGFYLENILRRRSHILSPEIEKLLADVSETAAGPQNIFSMFNNADIRFPEIEGEDGRKVRITHGNYTVLLESGDRRVRREAFTGLYHTYEEFRNTLAATYQANVKKEIFFARARNYDSTLRMALDGGNIPAAVYDSLIGAVHENLRPMYRYMERRRELLGLGELHMYDLHVPLAKGCDERYTFGEAKEIVQKALTPLGSDYTDVLKKGFDERWIDVYENEGKRSGAYSWGAYGTHPYVLMNYQGNLNNVFTLAHEMGHALHSYYSDQEQEYTYAGYRIFVAEVASTCNESLLIHYLLEHAKSGEETARLVNYFLDQFKNTLYRQTMFAEFERESHSMAERGETLTADALCKLYVELNRLYFGPSVVIDREIAMEWARIPHFYTPFYVYQYATGFAAAIAISREILAGNQEALKGYRKFLRGGSSMYPIELLKLCGVDMEEPEVVEKALLVFAGMVERL